MKRLALVAGFVLVSSAALAGWPPRWMQGFMVHHSGGGGGTNEVRFESGETALESGETRIE